MAVEAYIPSEVTFAGQKLEDAAVVTFYEPAHSEPYGSMTTPKPLPAGRRGGPLVVVGKRAGQTVQITVPEIEVRNKSGLGFEFTLLAPLQRVVLAEDEQADAKKAGPRLENLGATF